MAGSTGVSGSSNPSSAPPPPKILLAKPGLVSGGPVASKYGRGGAADDETVSLRSRLPPIGSLNLLSDSWDFHIDRFLPVLSLSLQTCIDFNINGIRNFVLLKSLSNTRDILLKNGVMNERLACYPW